jgi:hypothetical protein
MRRSGLWLAVLLSGMLLGACTGAGTGEATPSARSTPAVAADVPVGAQRISGGCGRSQVYQGPIPAWLEEVDGHNTPRGVPWVAGEPSSAAGFIFGYPLRAGHPSDPSNKVLWVVRTPRKGGALEIVAHPLGLPGPLVSERRAADSSPGEIYPDGIDVPTPGCWHFQLSWATGRAELDLQYL